MLFSHSILPLSKPAPDRARGHVVDEVAFLLAQAVIVLAAIERHVVGGREYSIDARLLLCLAKPLGGATVENFLHLGVAQSAAVLDALGHRINASVAAASPGLSDVSWRTMPVIFFASLSSMVVRSATRRTPFIRAVIAPVFRTMTRSSAMA